MDIISKMYCKRAKNLIVTKGYIKTAELLGIPVYELKDNMVTGNWSYEVKFKLHRLG